MKTENTALFICTDVTPVTSDLPLCWASSNSTGPVQNRTGPVQKNMGQLIVVLMSDTAGVGRIIQAKFGLAKSQ